MQGAEDKVKEKVGGAVNTVVGAAQSGFGAAVNGAKKAKDVLGKSAGKVKEFAKLRAARREVRQENWDDKKEALKSKIAEKVDSVSGAIAGAAAEAVDFVQSIQDTAQQIKSDIQGNPTTVVLKELMGLGSDFTCADPDTMYDASKFQIGGISPRGTFWEFNSPATDLNFEAFEYPGMDAQLKCRDGSWPTFNATVMTDKGEMPWEEACEAGVNQCGGAYDTECYGAQTEKSAAINQFLRQVFIPKFNPCCEAHDRGYCYPAGGQDIFSNWTSDEYQYAKGWHPYAEESTPYIYPNMLGGGKFPPYNPSGGKLAVDDRFEVCMHKMCAEDLAFGDDVVPPVQAVYESVKNAAGLGWVPEPLTTWMKEEIVARFAAKKNLARGWCDLRAQIAAAAVRAGGIKAYTAKQSALLTCPPPPDCSATPGCVEGAGDEVAP